jgi:hypothetical protein
MADFTWEDPGIGAFFKGQEREEARAKALSDLQTADVNRLRTLQEIYNSQQMLPLEIALKQKEEAFKGLINQKTEGEIKEAEQRRKREATDNFFNYMLKYNDPQGAVEYSGVPPQFAQKFMSLSPEQRDVLIKEWVKRAAEPERVKEEIKTQGKLQEIKEQGRQRILDEALKQQEMTRRALALQTLKNQAAMDLQKLKLSVSSMMSKTYQQEVIRLIEQAEAIKNSPNSGDPDVEAKRIEMINNLTQRANTIYMLDIQMKQAAAQQQQAGKPDIGAATGGRIPTYPQPNPMMPYGGQGGLGPIPQIGNIPAVPDVPPPGAVRPRR